MFPLSSFSQSSEMTSAAIRVQKKFFSLDSAVILWQCRYTTHAGAGQYQLDGERTFPPGQIPAPGQIPMYCKRPNM